MWQKADITKPKVCTLFKIDKKNRQTIISVKSLYDTIIHGMLRPPP